MFADFAPHPIPTRFLVGFRSPLRPRPRSDFSSRVSVTKPMAVMDRCNRRRRIQRDFGVILGKKNVPQKNKFAFMTSPSARY